jgi:pyruvate dehydrogenase E2 component (dihydrolipoamide acetyltransferase)
MPIEITMPRLSDTMEVGTILHWHVKVGDEVSAGDLLADIETDKATMELQSFDDGQVVSLSVGEGKQVEVGTLIATLREEDDDPQEGETTVTKDEPSSETTPDEKQAPTQKPAVGVKVSPVARRLAEEYGVALDSVQGSGPSGRIIKRDILQLVDTTSETTAAAETTKVVPSDVVANAIPATPVSVMQPLAPTSP